MARRSPRGDRSRPERRTAPALHLPGRGGRSTLSELLALPEPPDAVVATNNLMGVGALQVLNEHRLAPPAVGVAVVGRLPFTTMAPRDVTVVRLPARQMGMTAAKMLLERIDGDDQPARTIVLRHVLEPASDSNLAG
nr:substrate-binding domain-containing protein [Frondihabitans sucicola]